MSIEAARLWARLTPTLLTLSVKLRSHPRARKRRLLPNGVDQIILVGMLPESPSSPFRASRKFNCAISSVRGNSSGGFIVGIRSDDEDFEIVVSESGAEMLAYSFKWLSEPVPLQNVVGDV